jgi:hypothetical protein
MFSFKEFANVGSETTDEAWIDLISEEAWKQYYREMLVNEEAFQSERILC